MVAGPALRRGLTTSCGCLRQHGKSRTPEHAVWAAMIQRCTNPNSAKWKDYGARGISVHPRWRQSFRSFFDDVGSRPSPQHSLDRIDNDGNYEPRNVRWATRKEQARNKRSSRVLTVGGESATLAEWVERTGIGKSTIRERLNRGWSEERAVLTPVKRR